MFSTLVWSLQTLGYDLLRRIQFTKPVSLLAFFDKLTLPRPASIDASLVVRTGTHQESNVERVTRTPGTKRMKQPYKEINNYYA